MCAYTYIYTFLLPCHLQVPSLFQVLILKIGHFCLIFYVAVFQQAAYHPEVSEEVKNRALMYGSECTTGYIDLLEQVLLVG